jgi:hypothetical protein
MLSSYLTLKIGLFNEAASIPAFVTYKIKEERGILHTEQGNRLIQSD